MTPDEYRKGRVEGRYLPRLTISLSVDLPNVFHIVSSETGNDIFEVVGEDIGPFLLRVIGEEISG